MTPGYFQTLADYNRWANERLYKACAELGDSEYRRDRGAFFGTIHGTLNHILVGDRIWRARIEGVDHGIGALDEILCDAFCSLRSARAVEDAALINLVGGLDVEALVGALSYRNMAGNEKKTPMTMVLAHVFNHGTHHRGQVHNMLSQAGHTPPPLDLIYFFD